MYKYKQELEAIAADPLIPMNLRNDAQAKLDKLQGVKPAPQSDGLSSGWVQQLEEFIDNDRSGKPNPPEIAAQFKKARELENAFSAASDKLRAAVQNYAEDKFKDLPENGDKNCQVRNLYLRILEGFDFLPVGQKPQYPSEEIRQLALARNAANDAQFPQCPKTTEIK